MAATARDHRKAVEVQKLVRILGRPLERADLGRISWRRFGKRAVLRVTGKLADEVNRAVRRSRREE